MLDLALVLGNWGATVVIAIALVATIRKNGKQQKARDEAHAISRAKRETLTDETLKSIKEAIQSPKSGLVALKDDINSIKINCASVSTGVKTRLKALERRE